MVKKQDTASGMSNSKSALEPASIERYERLEHWNPVSLSDKLAHLKGEPVERQTLDITGVPSTVDPLASKQSSMIGKFSSLPRIPIKTSVSFRTLSRTFWALLFIVVVCLILSVIFAFSPSSWCGNGIVEAGEACDDANLDDSDGCTRACDISPGYECKAHVQREIRWQSCSMCPIDSFSSGLRSSFLSDQEANANFTFINDSVVALLSCSACPPNSTTVNTEIAASSRTGLTSIEGCVCRGGYSGPPGGPCTPCRAGEYKMSSGTSRCLSCPINMTSRPGSVSRDECVCLQGMFLADRDAPAPCSLCPPGKFKSSLGNDDCADCPLGHFSPEQGATSCYLCPLNTFMPSAGASVCVDCPFRGQVSDSGSTSLTSCKCPSGSQGLDGGCTCSSCPIGMFKSLAGPFACLPCPPGEFSNTSTSSQCFKCPQGTYQPLRSSSSCLACPSPGLRTRASGSMRLEQCECVEGYVGPAGEANCAACPRGTYKNELGGSTCLACSAGSFSETDASSFCKLCPAGLYSSSEGQTSCSGQCPFAFLSSLPGAASVSDCSCKQGYEASSLAFHFQTSANLDVLLPNCSTCPPGLYKNTTGNIRCTPCESGAYSTTPGSSFCTACPQGSTTLLPQSTTSADCSCKRGFQGSSSSACQACARGYYKEEVGFGSCMACPANSDTLALLGSTSLNDCVCDPGFTRNPATKQCEGCKAGSYKSFLGDDVCTLCEPGKYNQLTGKTFCVSCEPGKYQSDMGASQCYECPSRYHVTRDPSGKNDVSGSTTADACTCREGFYGPSGHHISPSGLTDCVPCPAGGYKDSAGPGPCSSCPTGSVMPLTAGTICSSCPAGTHPEAASSTCIACSSGTYAQTTSQLVCAVCEGGKFSQHLATSLASFPFQHVSLVYPFQITTDLVPFQVGPQSCTSCSPGQFSLAHSSACSSCSEGSYNSQIGSSFCSLCPRGQYQMIPGQTSCLACPVTTFSISMATVQSLTVGNGSSSSSDCLCPPGFSGLASGLLCAPCAAGKFKQELGNNACSDCPAGKFSNTSAMSSCVSCPQGKVSVGIGKTACLSCPANTTTLYSGSLLSSDCLCGVGYEGLSILVNNISSLRCSACKQGFFKKAVGNQLCEACQPGSFASSSLSSSCTLCPQGLYQDSNASSSCRSCPVLQTTVAAGAKGLRECKCQPGYEGTGSGGCVACVAGNFSARAGDACSKCPAGSYSDAAAASACRLCGFAASSSVTGSYQELAGSTFCRRCPSLDHRSAFGAASNASCICKEGYSNVGAGCVPCALGTAKASMAQGPSCLLCPAGTFANTTGLTSCISCPPQTSTRQAGSQTMGECGCVAGYWEGGGSQCSPCPRGFFKDSVGPAPCSRCPDFSSTSSTAATSIGFCTCTPGYFGAGGSRGCVSCARGTYAPVAALSSCLACPRGSFTDLIASSACQLCPAGLFSGEEGTSSCSECPTNNFSQLPGSTTCTRCRPGLLTESSSSTSCTLLCLSTVSRNVTLGV